MRYAIFAAVGLIVGVVIMFIAIVAIRARNKRRRRVRKRTPTGSAITAAEPSEAKRKFEFSKIVLMCVMLAYFITVGVGVKLSLIEYTQYSTLAMLVGAPTATAIGFYAWKAKAENVVKIKKENANETEGVTIDPSNIM